jgi:hypothetical protein
VIPFNVAFKLVTVLGIFLLPLATVVCLRAMEYPFPIPAIGSAACLLLLFNQGNSMWGGNIPSTLAGEFSFSIAFALAVLFVGLLYQGIRRGRHRAGLAVLLALVGLCHPVPFISAAGAGLYFLLDPARLRQNVAYLAWVYVAAALLMAFWLVPLIAGLPYATSIHWEWQFQSWLDVLPPMLILPAVLAVIDGVRLGRTRRTPGAGHYLLFSLLVSAAAFCAANSVGVPDIRFIPFAQIVILLLALDLLAAFLPALPAPGLPGLALVAATLGVVQAGAGYIPNWVKWNYEGIESKPQYPVLQRLMAALKGSLADPRVGYEHSPSYDVFGSMRIFESLPRLAGRATLEGVLLQTAVTSPFVYYIQSLVSEQGTSVIPGYSYPDSNPVRGTPRLDLFNVRDFLAVSDKVKAALDRDPRWTRLFVLEPYVIYRRTEAPGGYVRVPKFRPVLIETANWKKDFHRWFDKDDVLDVPLVSARTVPASARGLFPVATSPTELPRVPQTSPCAITEKVSALEIEFTTTCPGVPHYIAVSYHPNWRVEGAAGVFLASPAFMMVVPQQATVRLHFIRTAVDWAGILAMLAGVGLCFAMPRLSEDRPRELSPAAARRFRVATTAVLVSALVAIGVSVTSKVGAQYFARRAWHAFEMQDFARARREYDRTLVFGRGHASSADAMFWRATSLFRLDDCAAAIPAYEELITRVPENVWAPESQYQIGICQQRLGQPAAAAAAFRRTVEQYESSRWSGLAADRLRALEAIPWEGTR